MSTSAGRGPASADDRGRAAAADRWDSVPPPGEGRPRRVGPFSYRQLGLGAVVVALVGGLLFVATRPLVPGGTAGPSFGPLPTQYPIDSPGEGIRVGERAPELLVRDETGAEVPIRDLDGEVVSLAGLRGRPAWLNFWASWCPPCQAETPVLREIAEAYAPQGLAMVGISVQEATEDDVRAYADRYDLGYTIVADLGGDLFRSYRLFGLPTQFLLDGDGVVRVVIQGPVSVASAEAALRAVGLEPPTPAPTR